MFHAIEHQSKFSARRTMPLFIILIALVATAAGAIEFEHNTFIFFDTSGDANPYLAYTFSSYHRFEITQYAGYQTFFPVIYNTTIYQDFRYLGIESICNDFGIVSHSLFECSNSVFSECHDAQGTWYAESEAEITLSLEIHPKLAGPVYANCPEPYEDPSVPPPPPDSCPIIFDIDRNGFQLTGLTNPVAFDIDADGKLEEIGWTQGGQSDAFLTLDRNLNGLIDDGNELFGNHTLLYSGEEASNGFLALAEFDKQAQGGNEDGAIDARDPIFPLLKLWTDLDHDGISQEYELATLEEARITRIDLQYVETMRSDSFGNWLRYLSKAWVKGPGESELPIKATDVFFVRAE